MIFGRRFIMILFVFVALSMFSTSVIATPFINNKRENLTTVVEPSQSAGGLSMCYDKPRLNSDHIDYIASTTTVNLVASTADRSSSQYTGPTTTSLSVLVVVGGKDPTARTSWPLPLMWWTTVPIPMTITCPTCNGGSIDVTRAVREGSTKWKW